MRRSPAPLLVASASAALMALTGCHAATLRRPEKAGAERETPAGALSMLWRLELRKQDLFGPAAEACSTGALVDKRLIIGTRERTLLGVDLTYGQLAWRRPVGVQIDGEAAYDAERGVVYVGANDGQVFAVEPETGHIRWTYKAEGGVTQRPEVAGDRLFFTTNRGRLYAVDARDGRWLWDYERERPEDFTISGQAVPKVHGDKLFAGFADGFVVALHIESGEVAWARSLASASEQYVDVDTTPVFVDDLVVAGSHSGGLHGLSVIDGTVKWRLPVEGAGSGTLDGSTLYFAAPREGLHAVDARTGHVVWRRALSGAGNVTPPQVVGPYLVFSGSRTGLYVVERATGRLAQTFFPGRGMCAAPAIDDKDKRLYVLSNAGTLYAMNIRW